MTDTILTEIGKPERRETILVEAVRLFNESGYADTRLEDISARLGTAKTSVSYYFKSKEGLVQEVCDRALRFSELAMESALSQPTGRAGILDFVSRHAVAHAKASSGKQPPLALIADLPATAGAVSDFARPRYLSLLMGLRQLMERGRNDKSIKVSSDHACLFFLLNLLHWMPRWLSEVRALQHERAIEGMLDMLTTGIAEAGCRPWARPINRSPEHDSDSVFDRETRNRMKREALLRAGTRALNEHGFRGVSLNDVAGQLGVTRGALYYHFADKDALIQGCFERTCSLISTAQALAEKSELRGLEILMRALRWLLEGQVSNLDPLIRISLISALNSKTRMLVQARLSRYRSGFADMLARGMIDGSVRPLEILAVEHLIMGSVFAANYRRQALLKPLASSAGGDGKIAAAGYFEILLYGLAGPPSQHGA